MPRKLTQAQVEAYERDGYLCPVDAFSTERMRAWRDRLEAFEQAEGRKVARGHNLKPHLLFPGSTRSSIRPKCSTRSRT
jgi:hypothetical protein